MITRQESESMINDDMLMNKEHITKVAKRNMNGIGAQIPKLQHCTAIWLEIEIEVK